MKIFIKPFLLLAITLTLGCNNSDKKTLLIDFDKDPFLTKSGVDFSIKNYSAKEKFGDIIKVGLSDKSDLNHYKYTESRVKSIDFRTIGGNLIKTYNQNIIIKTVLKDRVRFDYMFSNTNNLILLHKIELLNDTTIIDRLYIPKDGVSPEQNFNEADYNYQAKTLYKLNHCNKIEQITEYHNSPFPDSDKESVYFTYYFYDKNCKLIRKEDINDDRKCTERKNFSYAGGLLKKTEKWFPMGKYLFQENFATIYEMSTYDYFPDNNNWNKRVERRKIKWIVNKDTTFSYNENYIIERKIKNKR